MKREKRFLDPVKLNVPYNVMRMAGAISQFGINLSTVPIKTGRRLFPKCFPLPSLGTISPEMIQSMEKINLDGKQNKEANVLICTPVAGEPYGQMVPIWQESIKSVMPNAALFIYHYGGEFPRKLYYRSNYGDFAKVMISHEKHEERPLLITDIDVLFHQPFGYEPSSDKIDLAMLGNLLGSGPVSDCVRETWKKEPLGEVASWLIWTKIDLLPYWDKWESVARDVTMRREVPNILTMVILNMIWNDLREEGRAELLPNLGAIEHVWLRPDRMLAMREMWEGIKKEQDSARN